METEGLLSCSRGPATDPYPDPVEEYSSYLHTLFL
jgi:hypothetical protein